MSKVSHNTLFLLVLSFQALSPLYCSSNLHQLGHISLLTLCQVPEGLSNSSILLHKFSECFFNSTYNFAISGDHGQSVGIVMEYIPLLDNNIYGLCQRLANWKLLVKKENIKENSLLTLNCASGSPAQHTHIFHRGQHSPA